MPKLSLEKTSNDTILPTGGGDKGVHTFLQGISLKVNVITWLEFELAYCEVTVQYVCHLTTETTPTTYDYYF